MGFEKSQSTLEKESQRVLVQFLDAKGQTSPEGKGEVDVVEIKLNKLTGEPVAILKFPDGHNRAGQQFEASWNQNERQWVALPMD